MMVSLAFFAGLAVGTAFGMLLERALLLTLLESAEQKCERGGLYQAHGVLAQVRKSVERGPMVSK